jgi:hypothetical protein
VAKKLGQRDASTLISQNSNRMTRDSDSDMGYSPKPEEKKPQKKGAAAKKSSKLPKLSKSVTNDDRAEKKSRLEVMITEKKRRESLLFSPLSKGQSPTMPMTPRTKAPNFQDTPMSGRLQEVALPLEERNRRYEEWMKIAADNVRTTMPTFR